MTRNTRKRTAAALNTDPPPAPAASPPPPSPAPTSRQASPAGPVTASDDHQSEPATERRPTKKARLSMKEQMALLVRELEEIRGSLQVAEESVRKYRKYKSMYVKEKITQTTHLIPHPEGERGRKGWTIRKALQLEGNTDLYLTILASVREVITAAGLDWNRTFHRQESAHLADCFHLIKEQNSYLKKFKGDWPACELVISCMQNKRKTRNRKRNSGVPHHNSDGEDGDGNGGGDDDDGEDDE
ncbi:hypothetical protein FRC04_005790 [Tulasnella sp. 424]|nr:hypothetical protein FRC04_005790 [Tulasnella sp. 424]